jgi:methionyl-tRNA synthetase
MKWEDEIREDLVVAGHRINKAELLFKKIEDAEIQAQLDKLADKKKENELKSVKAAPVKDETTFDNFTKMDIRVGTIVSAEKVKKTKKLLKIELDTGIDKRTVVSGIAEFFKPEDIIGQQVSVLVNLAPREIKGIESQGMILMAEDKDGSLSFVAPNKEVSAGSEIA